MGINYKEAYHKANLDYKKLIEKFDLMANSNMIISWLDDGCCRKTPESAFTEGAERRLAYYIESAINEGYKLGKMKNTIMKRLRDCPNDKARWVIIFSNNSLLEIKLDNDETYITLIDDNDDFVKLTNPIGNSYGVCLLLEQLEIKAEFV
jgi:hypothetical protein